MSLVRSSFQIPGAVDAPPQRFDYSRITPPEDFEFTFIGGAHHSGYGLPTFLGEMLADRSIIFLEGGMWEKEHERRYQAIANGGLHALKTTLAVYEETARRVPAQRPVIEYVSELHKQMYESNVRVVCVDYPKSHPGAKEMYRVFQSKNMHQPENFPLQLQRDQHMAESICNRVKDLRRFVKGFADISPLRGIAVMGAAHYVVADGLAEAARQKSITSFSAEVLFTEEPSQKPSDLSQHERPEELAAYQNWMRSCS